jgi:hypothetical protein
MKTLKLKSIIVSWIATVISIVAFVGLVPAQSTSSKAGLEKEKMVVNRDLAV